MMGTTNDKKRNLPDGWRWVRLGEVIAEVQAGFACGLRDPQGIAQLRMNNLDTRGNFVWDDVLRVPHEANDIDQFQILPGDVLFNNTNSTELVGKSALFEAYIEPIVYSNHFTRLRTVAESLLPEFLASWLNHQWQQGVFAAICNRWIGQSAVKSDKLLNLPFPLPTLSEQRRIAGLLREQMTAVEKARTAAQARLEAVKALPTAFLRQVFPQPGQPLPDGWRWIRLGEVCEIKGGKRLPNGTDYIEGNTQFPYIRVVDFSEGTVNPHNLKYIDAATQSKISRYIISRHDVYISIAGTIGLVGTIPDSLDGANLTENAARLLIKDKDVLHRDYLARLLMSGMGKEFIHERTNTVGQPKLALTRIATIPVPLPPLTEQEHIAGVLREQIAAVDKARAAVEEEINTINTLPAALLRRAFNGEL
jgi:type I restriction enzyme S subunit